MPWPFLFVGALYTLTPVTLSLAPPVSMAPATVRITIGVPRHEANRALCYSVDGPELKRSCFTLDGTAAQRTYTVYWTLRTPGTYQASAVLTRLADGRDLTFRSATPFHVIGRE